MDKIAHRLPAPDTFNLRVYGVLIEGHRLLLSDEYRMGMRMTKLPGGGVELGEGIEDALKREWQEELEVAISVDQILYVNPFFQPSAFDPKEQIISMYFAISRLGEMKGPFSTDPFDFVQDIEGAQVFRWISLAALLPETFTFPIDRALVPILTQTYL